VVSIVGEDFGQPCLRYPAITKAYDGGPDAISCRCRVKANRTDVLLRFGVFELDLSTAELRKAGVALSLPRQPLRILAMLASHPGQLVTREQIQQEIWGSETFVDFEQGLNFAVNKIRAALGDNAESPRYVETLPRRGYRFIAPVEEVTQGPAERPPRTAVAPLRDNSTNTLRLVEFEESVPHRAPVATPAAVWRRIPRWMLSVAVVLVVAVAIATFVYFRRVATGTESNQVSAHESVSIAVLPFQDLGPDKSMEFLELALPDELVTSLSHEPALSVRPFRIAGKHASDRDDPQTAGRQLQAAYVVSGHFLKDGDRLQVTLENTEVASNRVAWRETIVGNSHDLIGLQQQLAASLRQGLAPLLGGAAGRTLPASAHSKEAYDLYLRSLAITHDDPGNLEGIKLLEQSVQLDPGYAPAWSALGRRYHAETLPYANADSSADERAVAAYQHALLLDPNLINAAAGLIDRHVERGQLELAYREVNSLLRRRPDSPTAHLSMAYVLRYAGLLEDSAKECERAMELDPHGPSIPGCALTMVELGRLDRAMDFIRSNPSNDFTKGIEVEVLFRRNLPAEALRMIPNTKDSGRDQIEACLQKQPAPKIAGLTKYYDTVALAALDPELAYFQAGWDTFCGQNEAALTMLRNAVGRGYCAYPAVDRDPMLAGLRQEPAFTAIRAAAIECQNMFLTERAAR
jgi:DNA-binding winged helix-turn-helix (wHTH) protein/TolB-like protein